MHSFLRNPTYFYGWALFAMLPLAGCTTVETTAFTPIMLPGGCVIGNNYPACKSLNTTCSDPISIESSYYSYSDSNRGAEEKLSSCKNLFANCVDELALSGFIGHTAGKCAPQLIETENIQGSLDKEISGNIWYLNCADDKISGIGAFAVATSTMEDASAFTTAEGTSFIAASNRNESNQSIVYNHAITDTSGLARACTSNLQESAGNLGLSQFCISDFGSNAENYKTYLGSNTQSTVDYTNLPSTPICKPEPPTTTTTATNTQSTVVTTTTSTDSTPFTGITVGVGYTNSTISANNAEETDDNVTISVGYTTSFVSTTVGTTTVTPTLGINTSVTMGDQNFVPADIGGTTTTQYNVNTHQYETVVVGSTAATTQITNVVAIAAQPGLVINDTVQVYANIGAVVADKETSLNGSTAQVVGARAGGGLGIAITNNVSLNVQGNSDSVAGTHINSYGIGLNMTL